MIYRQGDVLLVRMDGQKPEAQETVKDGVLARGEATGHAHRIAPEDLQAGKAKVFYMAEPRRMIVEAFEPVRLVHEEHKPITLAPGVYEVRLQREYTPEALGYTLKALRYVLD
jgi:hypothetical protein